MIDLTGKRAVVTGASQGIGAAAAVALARAGAKIAFRFGMSFSELLFLARADAPQSAPVTVNGQEQPFGAIPK